MDINSIDVKENHIYKLNKDLLATLLMDRTSGKNIIWATDNYSDRGYGYRNTDYITVESITGFHGNVIKPRSEKSKKEQSDRIRKKAEVFTPSWICNKQNNLVDNAWFGTDFVFNEEIDRTWKATTEPIIFPTQTGKSWQDYINDVRLEITCGEAPYLVSRYDTVSGEMIDLSQRIGLLDRKLRVVSENVDSKDQWIKWAKKSYQNIYGFDWQGDNVLLARENLLFTFIDYYKAKFDADPEIKVLNDIAKILSWNIWQMDGLKFVIPDSCREVEENQLTLFEIDDKKPCPGCSKNDPYSHTGEYCIIKDWKKNKKVPFISILRKE
ncbi:restriction endonuclease subunit M [Congzhengia sp.]|uniref:restriction endonuclease subunit M n=1 Tax=Congzhengia sp. TaxID=2944168 RepID=UPI003077B0B0